MKRGLYRMRSKWRIADMNISVNYSRIRVHTKNVVSLSDRLNNSCAMVRSKEIHFEIVPNQWPISFPSVENRLQNY